MFARTINDFKVLDRNKMVIWAPSRSKAYLVELSMPMPELKFANSIAVVDRNHDGMLCGYGMDRIVVADSAAASFRTPATIMGMKRLDDAALAQLEQQYDVRLTRKKVAEAPARQPQDSRKAIRRTDRARTSQKFSFEPSPGGPPRKSAWKEHRMAASLAVEAREWRQN